MQFVLLAWVLLIQPNQGASPNATPLAGRLADEFQAEQVEFAGIDDCEIYAKKRMSDLMTFKKNHGKEVAFPSDVVPTYTCVER